MPQVSPRLRAVNIFTLAAVGLTLVACTPETESDNPWCPTIQEAMQDLPKDSFQYQALSDCEITEDEFMQALDHYKTCMANHGYEVAFHFERGRYFGAEIFGIPETTIEEKCSVDYVADVQMYHSAMRQNLKNVDYRLEIVACMQRRGVVDSTYTVDQLVHDTMTGAPTTVRTSHTLDQPKWMGHRGPRYSATGPTT